MATFVSGYISDLSPVKDNIKLCVRIIRTWLQLVYNKQHIKNMELIVMDEHNTKMQATARMGLINRFKHQLGKSNPNFRPYKPITDLQKEEDGQFDVVGQVVACKDLDNYDKNGKARKKKPLTLLDDEGNQIKCTLQDGVPSVIVGTVITIQEDEGWCPKKLRIGLMIGGAESARLGFRLQIRVQDETGTMSLSLFNDEVQAIVGRSAYQLCDNVLSLPNDPDIINSIIPCATPVKDNEASSKTALDITSLVNLESWTDENTTPTNAHKSMATSPDEKEKTNKRKAEGEPGSESKNGKKKVVEVKIEKYP
ncbi:replication protein A 70 kDa DNA-binding subunit B [Tanacetum coccineum]